jgi:transposase
LVVSDADREELARFAKSRTVSHGVRTGAQVILGYLGGEPLSALSKQARMSLSAVNRCLTKARAVGVRAALQDLPRPGRPAQIPDDARVWVVELACRKPTELGYPHEQWTISLLARHVREHAVDAGHPTLARAGKSVIHGILSANELHPHRVQYHLAKRDPDFDLKKAVILSVYQEMTLQQARAADGSPLPQTVTVSVDEKPGVQVLRSKYPDLPPVPHQHQHPALGRDYEYVRLGTLSLLAGLDLSTGHVHGFVRERHRSAEFIELLQQIDAYYPEDQRIRIVCDNHSAHTAKETQAFLRTRPGRFEFVFTPVNASWLSLVENLFSKMVKSVLRGIRGDSKDELATRMLAYWDLVNETPAPPHWKY